MKRLRHGRAGAERPALCDADGTVRVLSGLLAGLAGPGAQRRAAIVGRD
ncbi:hypothetical protein [Labrys monachus]|uniref:Uncharacterized protein n=1 Tax=Labrys monachus TaxID=217067 RepID=A0ABU0FFM1_9HYPH|nr:hypothetical protein [Labrys monachus]MDQ0393403.1 hypothetical protein [Labrys monachus]